MASKAASAASKYGKLWGRGYETFPPKLRRILSVSGKGDHATTYLQGLVTSDLLSEPRPPREEDEDTIQAMAGYGGASSGGGGAGVLAGASSGNGAEEPVEQEVPVLFTSKMRSTCFLDHRGRILTDAILWKRFPDSENNNNSSNSSNGEEIPASKVTTEYLIDVPGDTADLLFAHLKQHKLRRSKIVLKDKSEEYSVHAVYGTLNAEGAPPGYIAAMDPRHPSLGMRVLSVGPEAVADKNTDATNAAEEEEDTQQSQQPEPSRELRQEKFETLMNNFFPPTPGTYSVLRKLSGIAEGSEITTRTALECNQEFLNAISFSKGCYLGQELTARSQFTGVVRKRIVPVMIVETEMEVPRPWIMASMIQELGAEGGAEKIFGLDGSGSGGGNNGEKEKKTLELGDYVPPPLPKISAPGAGGIIAMMMGSISMAPENPQDGEEEDADAQERKAELEKLRVAGEKLQHEISELAEPGASIVDKQDGKTIGKIVSAPAPGTTVLLAQMRLDRLGLLGDKEKWSRTNRILIGDSTKEYRYLPYLPLWWPDIDPETGKEKVSDYEDDDELDEL